MFKRNLFLLCCVLFLWINVSVRESQALDNDFSLWPIASVIFPVGEKFVIQELVNPRINDNVTHFDELVLRSAIGYEMNNKFSLWAGYDWFSRYRPNMINESRPWQQVLLVNRFPWATMSNRLRMEERIFNDTAIARLRYRLRFDVPLDKESILDFVVFDELFINLNPAPKAGIKGGFDQNRLFVGLNREINEYVVFEVGYQMQYIDTPAQVMNHSILANLIIDFKKEDISLGRLDPTL